MLKTMYSLLVVVKTGRPRRLLSDTARKADMWMCLPDMNIARSSPSGIVIQDYLYVFGGKNEQGVFEK